MRRQAKDEVRAHNREARECFKKAKRSIMHARSYKSAGLPDLAKQAVILAVSFHRSGRFSREMAAYALRSRRRAEGR